MQRFDASPRSRLEKIETLRAPRTTIPSHKSRWTERAIKSQKAVLFAATDSGIGGAISAAKLKGHVRQLASYCCLPIGQKPKQQAVAYTAGMTLWPLIAPLKDRRGGYDGLVAEHVIVACNSASVRKQDSIALIDRFCRAVAERPDDFALPDEIKGRILHLNGRISENQGYLDEHVHEIVTPTAKAAAVTAANALLRDNRDVYFIRVDSTNGTAESKAYMHKISSELEAELAHKGYVKELVHSGVDTASVDNDRYVITHEIIDFTHPSQLPTKRVYLEGRGNPTWVNAIERGAHITNGIPLVNASMLASQRAAAGMSQERRGVFMKAPDLSMMCCTHYPLMQTYLSQIYGPTTKFLDQAAVVNDIVKHLNERNVDPALIDSERDDLELVITVGSQNAGGVVVPIDKARGIRSDIPKSIEDIAEKREMLSRTINAARASFGYNTSADIIIQTQDEEGGLQDSFETLHRLIALQNAKPIMLEQGYDGEFKASSDGRITEWTRFESMDLDHTPWGPKKEPLLGSNKIKRIPNATQKSIRGLASVILSGESRGVDKFAARVDVGSQLLAATAEISSLINRNGQLSPDQRQRIGIVTGFTVIDNATGAGLGGENDGPPGACIMAKTFLGQRTPVTLVTDSTAEASLINALELAGLATLKDERVPPSARRLTDYELAEGLAVEVVRRPVAPLGERYDIAGDQSIVKDLKTKLEKQNFGIMISIERPSVTNEGNLFSMLGKDISQHNMDLHELLVKSDDWAPYMIGIGDGGNELGTGQASRLVGEMRAPNLDLFVGRGTAIAASAKYQTDSMILASVSNTGGIALSMAVLAALNNNDSLTQLPAEYGSVVRGLTERGISIDGVNKMNAFTVDGRAMGEESDPPHELGTVEATHADMMKAMLKQFGLS